MNAFQYSGLCLELASRGFVVAAIDHPYDARVVVLVNGRLATFADRLWPKARQATGAMPLADSPEARGYRARVDVRTADVRFALTELFREGGAFADAVGPLDRSRIGVIGHSTGGMVAAEACSTDPRVTACVNLDGVAGDRPYYPRGDGPTMAQPFLFLTKPFSPPAELLARLGMTKDEWAIKAKEHDAQVFSPFASVAYRAVLAGATHESFSDDPFVIAASGGGGNVDDARRMLDIVEKTAAAFFEQHLGGTGASSFDDIQQGTYPEVTIERWNHRPERSPS